MVLLYHVCIYFLKIKCKKNLIKSHACHARGLLVIQTGPKVLPSRPGTRLDRLPVSGGASMTSNHLLAASIDPSVATPLAGRSWPSAGGARRSDGRRRDSVATLQSSMEIYALQSIRHSIDVSGTLWRRSLSNQFDRSLLVDKSVPGAQSCRLEHGRRG